MESSQASGGIKRIPLIYVAGPFAGETNYDVQRNVRQAESIALLIAQAGGLGVCPHTMNRNFFGQLNEEFWLQAVMRLLAVCDGIMLTPDWERSKGARQEFTWAKSRNLPYMVYLPNHEGAALMRIERWLDSIRGSGPLMGEIVRTIAAAQS